MMSLQIKLMGEPAFCVNNKVPLSQVMYVLSRPRWSSPPLPYGVSPAPVKLPLKSDHRLRSAGALLCSPVSDNDISSSRTSFCWRLCGEASEGAGVRCWLATDLSSLSEKGRCCTGSWRLVPWSDMLARPPDAQTMNPTYLQASQGWVSTQISSIACDLLCQLHTEGSVEGDSQVQIECRAPKKIKNCGTILQQGYKGFMNGLKSGYQLKLEHFEKSLIIIINKL